MVFHKDKSVLGLIVLSVCVKLTISPWATGDFESELGLIFNYACDGLLLLAVVTYSSSVSAKYHYIYISSVVSAFSYAASTFIYTDIPTAMFLNLHLKVYLPILILAVLSTIAIRNPEYFLIYSKRVAAYVTTLIVIGLLFLPYSNNRNELWWPSYFGGLHTTAYVALMVAFIVYGLARSNLLPAKVAAAWFLSLALIVYFGWGVRTATLALLVFLAASYINRSRIAGRNIYPLLIPFTVVVALLGYTYISSDLIDSVSSGRISMYQEKYTQLMNNNLIQWLIGNGRGSDLIETDVWWWEAKGAHSDLITFLVEGGILYLFLFIALIAKLIRQESSPEFSFILIAALVTSAFSNGIFVRPAAAYLMAFALVTFTVTVRVGHDSEKK